MLLARRTALAVLVGVSAVPVAVLSVLIGISQDNKLRKDARWESSKTAIGLTDVGLMGSKQFIARRQALAGNHLDLGAWHGYQEVWLREPVEAREVRLRFTLDENAYLVFRWQDGRRGLRLSRHERYPSALLEIDAFGRFLRRDPLALPRPAGEALADGWAELRVRFGSDATRFWLDDRPVAVTAPALPGPQRIGFRGGQASARLDDVCISFAEGGELCDSFDAHDRALPWIPGALLALWILEIGALRALALGRPPWLPEFAVTLANLVLCVGLAAFLILDRHVLAARYTRHVSSPDLFERERSFTDERTVKVSTQTRERYARAKSQNTLRVMLIGSSQTEGAGARGPELSFARQLEALLAARLAPRSVELINTGISAQRSPVLLELYREQWIHYDPDLVIVNLSNNDEDLERFEESLRQFARLGAQRGIRTVFVQEPNSLEGALLLLPRHRVMERVAREEGVPLVRLHDRLGARADSGFLWWDFVHPTDYGHRLIAEILAEEIDWAVD